MKVSRDSKTHEYKVLEGYVLAARKTENGNLEVDLLTYANDTPYKIEITPHDLSEIRSFTQSFTGGLL